MKSKFLLLIAVLFASSSFWNFTSAQAPLMGTASDFVLFTSVGAVGNTGISQLTGNVGTNSGATTGFGNVNGVMHNADAASTQCATDLLSAWYQLDTTTPTALHIPVLGNGETLYAGVYALAAAGSLVSVLILDAQGDSNAVFIFKTGGAFTTAASSSVVLINGAVACNVFWKAEGAISLAASTTMKGTLIAHNGAIDLGAGCSLEGRAMSTTGSATFYGTNASIPTGCGRPLLTGPAAPALGFAQCFALFSANGLVSNAGSTNITGDVGTNNGLTTGYNPLLVTGMVHPSPDLSTTLCASDLLSLQTYLAALPYDIELLYPAQFGNRLVLTPHTYRMNAAAVLDDTLYLDGGGNTNAVFVIQVNGAFSTGTYAKVSMRNGVQSQNVYWVITGAVTIDNDAVFCGNIICIAGAISLLTGSTLDGRAFTEAGDVVTDAVTAQKPGGLSCLQILPVQLLNFTGSCNDHNVLLQWTDAEPGNHTTMVERSVDGHNWNPLGTVSETNETTNLLSYSFTDRFPVSTAAYYRLQQADAEGRKKYGNMITVRGCGIASAGNMMLYPNPSTGTFTWQFNGDPADIRTISIFNAIGEEVYASTGFRTVFDLSANAPGLYFMRVSLKTGTITSKILVAR
jgi:hypothetical protein